jgi:serine/threonine protein phosphatase PrpC
MVSLIEIWIGSICQQGLARQNIEDCIFIRNRTDERYAILGVSDGIGGLEYGEIASSEVCEFFNVQIISYPEQFLLDKAEKANEHLFSSAIRRGATLTAAVIDKQSDNFWALSIGDSRIYHYTATRLIQLSADDKYLSKNIFAPNNIITKAVGIKEKIPTLKVLTGKLKKGESLLLTTDGIHTAINNEDIKETLQFFKKNYILNELTKQALCRGSEDDMAAIYICKE